jgi:hypothetical protein
VAAAQSRGRAGFRTTAKETGSNASPVGRISFSNIDDARNERLATLRQDRGHGVAKAIAIKIAIDLEFVCAARAKAALRASFGLDWFGLDWFESSATVGGACRVEQMDK